MFMGVIALEGMEFYAFHGYYESERKKGNTFLVDVYISTDFEVAASDDELEATVNYENVYNIVKEVMAEEHKLLERLARRVIDELHAGLPDISSARVRVSKLNPPIEGVARKAWVEEQREF